MPNKKGVTYNSKSVLILKNYNPEDIQKLLNSGLYKKDISKKLGVHYNAFIKYIKENNLTYTTPSKKKPVIDNNIKEQEITMSSGRYRAEIQDQSYALMRYRELVLARKEKEKLNPKEPEVYHHDLYKKS